MIDRNLQKGWLILLSYLLCALAGILLTPDIYESITREDHLVEYGGFLFFLLAAWYSYRYPIFNSKWSGILISLFFLGIAGEEISWGQRILGFSTPEFLESLNNQNEFNIHNINKKFFDRMLIWVGLIYLFISTILMRNYNGLLKELFRSPYLHSSVFLVALYQQYNAGIFNLALMAWPLIFFLMLKNSDSIFPYVLSIMLGFFIILVHVHFQDHFSPANNSANEIREMMFAWVCLVVAYAQKGVKK